MARLDTHVVVWLHAGDRARLSPAAVDAIEDAPPVISPMVVLELNLLHEIGRLAGPASEVLTELGARIGLEQSDRRLDEVVRRSIDLTWTRDPFDRLIVADALAAGEPLVTIDRTIRRNFSGARW